MGKKWSRNLPVVQFRLSHPTNQLEKVKSFYHEGLGLPVIFSYEMDQDYDGVMFGLPGKDYHLEITQHQGDGPCPVPPPDTLLVFYIPDRAALIETSHRLEMLGYQPVPPRNPYWAEKGLTFADPDGLRIVLMNTAGFGDDIA